MAEIPMEFRENPRTQETSKPSSPTVDGIRDNYRTNLEQCLQAKSEKEKKLLSLLEAGFNIPPFRVLTGNQIREAQNINNLVHSMSMPEGIEKLIIRSSHPLEGNNGLSWTGVFESIPNTPVNLVEIQRAYDLILKNDFKALRYAKRHDIKDFQMSDMQVMIMPCLPWTKHIMFRSRPESWGGGLNIQVSIKGQEYGDSGAVDNPDCDPDSTLSNQYRKEADLTYQIINHFNAPQEIEMCEYNGKLYVLQSRDFDPEKELTYDYPDSAEIPDKDLPIYVIDESQKEPDTIDSELREFGLTHNEYVVLLLDVSKTTGHEQERYNNRGSEWKTANLGYGPFLEEATVSFILPSGCRTWGDHYKWKTDEFHCFRIHSPYPGTAYNTREILQQEIKDGVCNPTTLYSKLPK